MDDFRFAYRRYRLAFRHPVRTARALWAEREGLIVRLEAADGRVGWGEAAPVPAFGMEGMDDLEAAARNWPSFDPARVPTLENALRAAQADMEGSRAGKESSRPAWAVAALLPAGRAAIAVARERAAAGFRTFKWKVGVEGWRDEASILDDVCAAIPEGARLRLDANGAWDRRTAEQWLARCAERPVELVEQPVGGEDSRGEDLLRGLAADFPTPIGLDESLVGEPDLERWLGSGWPGVYVIKPSLFADAAGALRKLAAAKAKVIFSSAIETAVGARAALQLAFAWEGERAALGFGVWPIFQAEACDGPALAPFIRPGDLDAGAGEKVWNALS